MGLWVNPMRRFSTWAGWIIGIIFGSQFALEVFKQVAQRIGLYDRPREALGTVLNFLLSLAELPWLRNTLLFFGGLAAGFLLKWLLQNLDGSRAKQREALGTEMRILGHDLNLFGARPQITSCFIAARKLGLWVPDQHIFTLHVDFAEPLIKDYLLNVGTMLKDGHFREAKQYAAVNSKVRFDKAYAQFRLRDRPIP